MLRVIVILACTALASGGRLVSVLEEERPNRQKWTQSQEEQGAPSHPQEGDEEAPLLQETGALLQEEDAMVVRGEYGTYELGKKLGSGAYGQVYLATETSSRRKVVVKKIDLGVSPEAQTSFDTERRVWKHMRGCPGYPHRNVIEYFEVVQLSQREGAVVMELAGGGSLSSLLYQGVSAEGALRGTRTAVGTELLTDEAQAKLLFGQLAAGAQWLAECGVIHKDLKPDNIMLSDTWGQGGELKIIDFGLAAVLATKDSGPLANMYYNLEQSVDIRSQPGRARTFDNFALGMILAEFGTGVPPFFNPSYDYFSEKPGNLQGEKGIMYILTDKRTCAKGDKGLWYPKKDLAKGVISIRTAVQEVAGRSLYFLQKGSHFPYTSATENGIGNTALLSKSWLSTSSSAMALLQGLIAWDDKKRIDPSQLMSSDWLSGSGGQAQPIASPGRNVNGKKAAVPSSNAAGTGGQKKPASSPRGTGGQKKPALSPSKGMNKNGVQPKPGLAGGDQIKRQLLNRKPEARKPKMPEPQASKLPKCRNPHKKRSAPSVCSVGHYSGVECSVELTCLGQAAKAFTVGPQGGIVPDCQNCQLSTGGGFW